MKTQPSLESSTKPPVRAADLTREQIAEIRRVDKEVLGMTTEARRAHLEQEWAKIMAMGASIKAQD